MYTVKIIGFLLGFFLIQSCVDHTRTDTVRIENEVFVKSFICKSKGVGVIRPQYILKLDRRILNQNSSPYFEFVVNGELVTSEDPLWIYGGMHERSMKNGGSEYTLEFRGGKGVVKDLGISIKQQVFPGSALVREQLVLHSPADSFFLNKLQGKLHFIFPAYAVIPGVGEDMESTEIRLASWEQRSLEFDPVKKGNHMYYPEVNIQPLADSVLHLKGPIHILSSSSLSLFCAYEHASQDHTRGLLNEEKKGVGSLINDAMQGTEGVFNFPLTDADFLFQEMAVRKNNQHVSVSIEARRGAYLDGECIDPEHSYESLWTATAFYPDNKLDRGKELLREYLLKQICENTVSRTPEFYYNTWGMQREDPERSLRGILTYERILEEIEYAAQLGVDIFVLDDGWEQAMGIWVPHKDRMPEGLKPVKEKLDEYGMKMGLWFSPMGIDSTTLRYKEHPEWVIRDSEGNPIRAQWGHPAFDFVSDYSDLFIEDCKALIDQGCRFMKWDAINTFYSSLPGLHHGSESDSPEERRARYEYLLPIYVVKAMEILTHYEPELIIEIDLTEARRAMIGLAPLSQGKLFFMNNGASTYNDYSSYRTKSLRTIVKEYAGIIPLELFTYASYPHNLAGSMKYNVANALLAGHGFWGDLSLMSREERHYVGQQVEKAKRILPYVSGSLPLVQGNVGDAPELYRVINEEEAAGQIVAFSSGPASCRIKQSLAPDRFLAALNQPYHLQGRTLEMDLFFPEKESGMAIFILPNMGTQISIRSSSVALTDVCLEEHSLMFGAGGAGEQVICWPVDLGKPEISGSILAEAELDQEENHYLIHTYVNGKGSIEVFSEPMKE